MTQEESLHGLNCPNCGGMVPIPEGQMIVRCPYCDMRSFVKGERGVMRYQVPQRIQREQAEAAYRGFLSSNMAIAPNARRQSKLSEAFLVYLPFWTIWGRVGAWAFGEEKVGSGDRSRYEPREVRFVQEMTWNGAACDVGEFGVNELLLTDQELQAFNPEALHNAGMVFEPSGSFSQAREAAEKQFEGQVRQRVKLDRLAQLFIRFFRQRQALVYYPLWVMRYLYRGRSFQVVVDGYSGKVLYGKAPGNILYRAGVLVLGMAVGAFLAIDVNAGVIYTMGDDSDSGILWLILGLLVAGGGLMLAAYRKYRYGEFYEFRTRTSKKSPGIAGLENPFEVISQVTNIKDIEGWINRFN